MIYGGAFNRLVNAISGGTPEALNPIISSPCQVDAAGNYLDPVGCQQDNQRRQIEAEREFSDDWWETPEFTQALIAVGSAVNPGAGALFAAGQATLDGEITWNEALNVGVSLATTNFDPGGSAMWDDLFDTLGDWSGALVDEASSWDWGAIGGTALDLTTNYLPVANRTQPRPPAGVPAPAPGTGQGGLFGGMLRGGAVATVGRSFFNRFPNLATAIQRLRNAGQNVSRSKLYSMLKRFGPEFLISGGILTAAAVNELALAGPGHRRMNPANGRALKRSIRRIQSFHRLCKASDVIARHSRRKKC